MSVEQRLRAAGQQYRASRTDPVAVDPGPPSRRPRTALIAGLAAAAVIVLVLGTVLSVHELRRDAGDAAAAATLRGATWYLVEADGSAVDPTARRVPTVEFDEHGGFTVDDTCNEISGKTRVGADSLTFTDVGSTAVGCGADPVQQAVQNLILHGRAGWRINGDVLMLIGAGHTLRLRHSPVVPARRLVGTGWNVADIRQNGNGRLLGARYPGTLRFVSSTRLRAFDGCHWVYADYRAEPDSLMLSEVMVDANTCPAGRTEDPFLRAVLSDGEIGWWWNGELMLTRGATEITYVRA